MKKWLKYLGYALIVALIVTQFMKKESNTGGYEDLAAFRADTKPTAEVEAIMQSSCYDCHSNQTTYPWYNNIGAVSLWLDHHIEDGKKHLNFAAWDAYSVKKKDHKLDELIEEVEEGEMPLKSYKLTHGDARLTEAQIQTLITWAQTARLSYQAMLPQ